MMGVVLYLGCLFGGTSLLCLVRRARNSRDSDAAGFSLVFFPFGERFVRGFSVTEDVLLTLRQRCRV